MSRKRISKKDLQLLEKKYKERYLVKISLYSFVDNKSKNSNKKLNDCYKSVVYSKRKKKRVEKDKEYIKKVTYTYYVKSKKDILVYDNNKKAVIEKGYKEAAKKFKNRKLKVNNYYSMMVSSQLFVGKIKNGKKGIIDGYITKPFYCKPLKLKGNKKVKIDNVIFNKLSDSKYSEYLVTSQ